MSYRNKHRTRSTIPVIQNECAKRCNQWYSDTSLSHSRYAMHAVTIGDRLSTYSLLCVHVGLVPLHQCIVNVRAQFIFCNQNRRTIKFPFNRHDRIREFTFNRSNIFETRDISHEDVQRINYYKALQVINCQLINDTLHDNSLIFLYTYFY